MPALPSAGVELELERRRRRVARVGNGYPPDVGPISVAFVA
jgi:hypothetical protein